MFLLVTGASGAGKSTVRELIAPHLAPGTECVELHDVVNMPTSPTLEWRQRATEATVVRALELQAEGRSLLLSGDPVAAGEVLAAPSADKLGGIAVCLLDVNQDAQAARLCGRGDDPALLADHQAFAEWMRAHARDPRHMPHVLSTGGWEEMRWERWRDLDPRQSGWSAHVVDTSPLTGQQVAGEVLGWCRRALAGSTLVMHVATEHGGRRGRQCR